MRSATKRPQKITIYSYFTILSDKFNRLCRISHKKLKAGIEWSRVFRFSEVIFVEEHTLSVRSITYAMKAQNLLNRYGIPCRIVRDRSIRRGCGYHIIVRGDLQRILALLSQHGIKAGKESS